MLPLETKQTGGKLLPHSDLRARVFLEEVSRSSWERDHWGDPEVDGRIILRWIFGKWEGVETEWSWLRIGTDGGHL